MGLARAKGSSRSGELAERARPEGLCRPPEVSDLPFYLPNLPDEIRPLVILRHRCRNARRLAGLNASEHPRHVAA